MPRAGGSVCVSCRPSGTPDARRARLGPRVRPGSNLIDGSRLRPSRGPTVRSRRARGLLDEGHEGPRARRDPSRLVVNDVEVPLDTHATQSESSETPRGDLALDGVY